MNTAPREEEKRARSVTLGHCFDAGTGVTNFSTEQAEVYREAIKLHGDPLVVISRRAMDGGDYSYSLHDLSADVRRDLSDFWNVFDLVDALYTKRKLFGVQHTGAAQWVRYR